MADTAQELRHRPAALASPVPVARNSPDTEKRIQAQTHEYARRRSDDTAQLSANGQVAEQYVEFISSEHNTDVDCLAALRFTLENSLARFSATSTGFALRPAGAQLISTITASPAMRERRRELPASYCTLKCTGAEWIEKYVPGIPAVRSAVSLQRVVSEYGGSPEVGAEPSLYPRLATTGTAASRRRIACQRAKASRKAVHDRFCDYRKGQLIVHC